MHLRNLSDVTINDLDNLAVKIFGAIKGRKAMTLEHMVKYCKDNEKSFFEYVQNRVKNTMQSEPDEL